MEESGIKVKDVKYYASQPWPFPWSLMIGCHAKADSDEINFDEHEMHSVKWFHRDEVLSALEDKNDDEKIGVNSTAILWGNNAIIYSKILHLFFYVCL